MSQTTSSNDNEQPDSSAVRVALWRALHLLHDAQPPILRDEVGLELAAPGANWQLRPDMHLHGTAGYRAGIVARARFIEDLVMQQARSGLEQYILLGAGLDTFAQRRLKETPNLKVFEIDQPGTQKWKKRRLAECGFEIPERLKFVPVDFEAGESWREKLLAAGCKAHLPSLITSTGVSPYLTLEANQALLHEAARFAPESTLVLTFILPMHMVDPAERATLEMVYERARAAGTPFLSFFEPVEIMAIARKAGFRKAEHISREEIIRLYFNGRSDGLKPASGEEYLVATI